MDGSDDKIWMNVCVSFISAIWKAIPCMGEKMNLSAKTFIFSGEKNEHVSKNFYLLGRQKWTN